jgi:DNA polymerase III subunit alpha
MNNIKNTLKKEDFVNLHGHSCMSLFDGFGFPQEHMDFAHGNGSKALALTDHGSMNGLSYQLLRAKEMKAEGKDFKPIFGVEAYYIDSLEEWQTLRNEIAEDKKRAKEIDKSDSAMVIEDEQRNDKRALARKRHIVLLAQNQKGLENIYEMVSKSYTGDYFYRKPRIDWALLNKHQEGVIVATACLGGIAAGSMWKLQEEGEDAIVEDMVGNLAKFRDTFGDRFFAELQWNNIPEQHLLNKCLIKVAQQLDIKLISTCDSHYPSPEAWRDREVYKRLGWLGKMPAWMDKDIPESVEEIGYELYPKNAHEMWDSYKRYADDSDFDYDDDLVMESITNTAAIAFEQIEDFLPDTSVQLPSFMVPSDKSADEALEDLAEKALALYLRGSDKTKKRHYRKRLAEELDVISSQKFSEYFLATKAITDFSWNYCFVGPARGSAAGSLLAFLLRITQIDPMKWGLPFERFMTRGMDSYPDVDIDFSDNSLIKDKMVEEWGEDSVAFISNYNTMQLSSLIKDISKREDVPFTEVNIVTKAMFLEATPIAKKKHGIKAGVYTPTFQEVCDYSTTLQAFFRKYPHIQSQVLGLVGSPRSIGRHAAGAIIGDYLPSKMPLITSKGIRQTPWAEGMNVRHLEPLGFIKFDILGLETLKTFEDTIKRILVKEGNRQPSFEDIKSWYYTNLHPSVLDMTDQQVYKGVFHNSNYAGIFQFMNSGMQRLGTNAKVSSIEEIATVSAIYRPGPLSANVDKMYVKAKEGIEEPEYAHPLVEQVLGKTFGLIVFQEDIMNLVNVLGDKITMTDANVLRKLLTKKGLSETKMRKKKDLYERFVKGCEKKGMSFTQAKVLWEKMEYFSGYGFSKNHAIPYSIISYQCAWLQTYYQDEWIAAFLDHEPDKRKEAGINIARSFGYEVAPLDINTSGTHWEANDGTLIPPLTTIKGLGDAAIDEVIFKRPFSSIEDLLFDKGVVARKVNKKSLDAMCRAGAMESLMDDRFFGDKHFWSAVVVDKPKNKKKLGENIEKYKDEGTFTKGERISHLQALTGIYPINMVVPVKAYKFFEMQGINPLSEYDRELGKGWCIPTEVTTRKTKTGKAYYQVTVIDSSMKTQRINCWGVNPKTDFIYPHRLYVLEWPKYNATWGFSTTGGLSRNWKLLG